MKLIQTYNIVSEKQDQKDDGNHVGFKAIRSHHEDNEGYSASDGMFPLKARPVRIKQ